jgi:2'-5' RNA ligase
MDKIERAIVIFPKFANSKAIDRLRKQFDPLALTMQPHITLVFPFMADLFIAELQVHVEQAIQGMRPFPVQLRGITGSDGEYLFLNVKLGNDELIGLHDRLYGGVLRPYLSAENTYTPHLTVGRLRDPAAFLPALETTRKVRETFNATIEEVAIYRMGDGQRTEAIVKL